jgi:NAD(P)-dependent dehydrogenase (short-subunit alcohol dehydrogenase family)
MSLEGQVFVITGANTGIGLSTARELARRRARVILACRSRERTEPVLSAIREESKDAVIEFLELDLANLASVRRAAAQVLERERALHVLINNAGVAGQRGVTADGFELAFGVNHLGHFLFTALLLDRIRASAPSRVVTVASKAHYRATGIDWQAVRRPTRSWSGFHEYQVSKLANVLFSAELARRLEGSGVSTYSLHPGVIASDIWRRIPWPLRPVVTGFMSSVEEGANTTVYCATSSEIGGQSGLYWDECAPKRPSYRARDAGLAAELWARSEDMCRG